MAQLNEDVRMICEKILGAARPDEIFGLFSGSPDEILEARRKEYRKLSKKIHPDLNGNHDLAKKAFQQLSEMYAQAEGRGSSSHVDEEFEVPIQTRKANYILRRLIAEEYSELSDVYRGDYTEAGTVKPVVVKLVRNADDSDLVQNEVRVLQHLWSTSKSELTRHLPTLIDRFRTEDGKLGLVFEDLHEYVNLVQLHSAFPRGLDSVHLVWIMKRLLSVAGFAHGAGVTHCNICPEHILIRARDHNLALIDWSYGAIMPAKSGETFRVKNRLFSPPETSSSTTPKPQSDLYSIGLCGLYLAGGDVETKRFPARLEPQLRQFLEGFLIPSSLHRVGDALEMHNQLETLIREKLHWPRKFHKLELPTFAN